MALSRQSRFSMAGSSASRIRAAESPQVITLRAGTANLDYTQNLLFQSFLQTPHLT